VVDQIGGGEDEHLAHHVRALLVAAHDVDVNSCSASVEAERAQGGTSVQAGGE
jgi:hypothetical protein